MKAYRLVVLIGIVANLFVAFGCGLQQNGESTNSVSSSALVVGQAAQPLQNLHSHVRPAVSSGKAARVGHMPASQRLNLSIALQARNQAALSALLGQLYDPTSSNYRHFLSVEQFTEQFGPSADDYQAVVDFANAKGLAVTGRPANRMLVSLSGTAEQVEKAFNVTMNVYQHPTDNRTFFSPDREPSLNLRVPVHHISGLNNYSIPRSAVRLPSANRVIPDITGSGPGGTSYLASDMRAAYYSTTSGQTGLTGSGQVVGLFQFAGYNIRDVVSSFYGKATSTPNGNNYILSYTPVAGGTTYGVQINNVLIDGASATPASGGDDTEETLDIVQSVGMAPGLSQVRVYIGNLANGLDDANIFNAMASENMAKQISCSWAWEPDDPASDDFIFQEFAAQGQTLFAASGDWYAFEPSGFDSAIPEHFPAEDPWVTSVGGTDLTTTSAGGAWSSETAWALSSGGISLDGIAIPSWQVGVADTANGGSTTLRNVPDVAAEADEDNYYCDMGTCAAGAGGTSFASPRWAGFMALANQQAVAAGRPTLGFLNPTLYAIGKGSSYASDFHDITSGNNNCNGACFAAGAQPSFNAVTGYDLVTGWGSPTGQALINTLAPAATQGFELSASPSSLTIAPSASGTTTIKVEDVDGFTGSVALSVSGLPSGVTASFDTNPTSGSSVLTLNVASSDVRGSYLLTVTGISGARTASTVLALEVNASGFSIGSTGNSNFSSSGSLVLYPGTTGSYFVGVTDFAGFTGEVTFAVTSGLPSGLTATWSSNPTSATGDLLLTASSTVEPERTL